MQRLLVLVILVILILTAASPVVFSPVDSVEHSNDTVVAALQFEVMHLHADPDCPSSSGGGSGC